MDPPTEGAAVLVATRIHQAAVLAGMPHPPPETAARAVAPGKQVLAGWAAPLRWPPQEATSPPTALSQPQEALAVAPRPRVAPAATVAPRQATEELEATVAWPELEVMQELSH